MDKLDWNHVYLLGWYDHSGRSHLSTWHGDFPVVTVVVFGVNPLNIPLWDALVPPNARFELASSLDAAQGKARSQGGYAAFGWYIEKGFERRDKTADG